MKIFLDSADIDQIKQWSETGLIDGITTNPSLLAKNGGDPKKVVRQICAALPNGQVSIEVTEKDPQAVYKQALVIADIAPNVVVKIPGHVDYYPVIDKLVKKEISLNITLVFTLLQSLMMCKLGVTFISPFVGRLDDIDADGIGLLFKLREMIDQYGFDTQILAASIRGVADFAKAVEAGVDVVTVSPTILHAALNHPLIDKGIEQFDADWKKLPNNLFP